MIVPHDSLLVLFEYIEKVYQAWMTLYKWIENYVWCKEMGESAVICQFKIVNPSFHIMCLLIIYHFANLPEEIYRLSLKTFFHDSARLQDRKSTRHFISRRQRAVWLRARLWLYTVQLYIRDILRSYCKNKQWHTRLFWTPELNKW